jgi:2-dehydropantoate 2-reductase
MVVDRSIVVFGAGAVGGYLGAKLSLLSPDLDRVRIVGREAVVRAVQQRGLLLREFGLETAAHPCALSSARGLGRADLVMLTVRTHDVQAALSEVAALLGESGILLALQNGVGTEEVLADACGRDRVLIGTLTVSAGMEEPGVVTRYSKGGGVALSTMDGTPVPTWIVSAFEATRLPTIVIDDYRSLRWSKLLLNMLGAATTAILDMDVSEVMTHPKLFRVEQLAFREAVRVMDAQGITTVKLPGYPVPLARTIMRLPRYFAQALLGRRIASARSGRSPGMRADLKRGRSEISAYNGAVVEAGRRLKIPAPTNQALTELTLTLAEHPDQRADFKEDPEALLSYLRQRGIKV